MVSLQSRILDKALLTPEILVEMFLFLMTVISAGT